MIPRGADIAGPWKVPEERMKARNVSAWVQKVREHLAAGWMHAQWVASQPVYAVVSTAAIWPVVEALKAGDPEKLFPAFMSIVASVSYDLWAKRLEQWKDQGNVTEADVAGWVHEQIGKDHPQVLADIDAINQALDTISAAKASLKEQDRQRFVDRLTGQLELLGNLEKFRVSLNAPVIVGSPGSAVAHGRGATAQTGRINVVAGPGAKVEIGGKPRRKPTAGGGLTAYLDHLAAEREHINLGAVDHREAGLEAVTKWPRLVEVYAPLQTETAASGGERQRFERRGGPVELLREEVRRLSAVQAAARDDRLVVLGDPGSGKSTFLKHFVFCLAKHRLEPGGSWLKRLPGWPSELSDRIPIPIVLTDLDDWLPRENTDPGAGDVWAYIESRLTHWNLRSARSSLLRALDGGKAIVVLDGLDEVRTVEGRQRIARAVHAVAERYKKCQLLVTCRVRSYQPPGSPDELDLRLPGFRTTTLAPLEPRAIHAFVDAWYAERERLGALGLGEGAGMAGSLRAAIEEQGLGEFASNPLLLTVMAQVHAHRGQLPTSRAVLYEWVIDLLLFQWEQAKGSRTGTTPALLALLRQAECDESDLRRTLWHVAFQAHKTRGASSRLADILEEVLRAAIREMHPHKDWNWAQAVVDLIKQRAGLLVERAPGIYTFPHGTFQEYLAGAHLSAQNDFAEGAPGLFEGANRGVWDVPLILAVGRLVHYVGHADRPLALVGQLCPEALHDTAQAWHQAWVAGEALVEMGVGRVGRSPLGHDLLARVRARLRELVERGRLSPVERVAAGDALGKLGDPRFREDAGFLPDDDWLGFVEIPKGPFVMGSDPTDKRRFGDEFHPHEVELPRYYLARYPVTVAQFKAFVEVKLFKAEDPDCLKGLPNHPVVWVSWHEARAYCDWLTDQLRASDRTPPSLADLLHGRVDGKKWRVTLPSEAEWEKAARGPKPSRRAYPWGDEPDPDAANYDETGIGGTSPVGCFPKGKSQPYDVQDLSGNVWEWTRSLWGKDLMKPDRTDRYVPGREAEDLTAPDNVPRVLRGGAFYYTERYARCAVRYRLHPCSRDWDIGFRVAVSPFVSDP